jgi:MFS family permease
MTESQATPRVFYGWWLMLVTFAILFLGGGYGFYSFTVFMIPLEQEFGWTRDVISGAASAWAICFALASPLVGYCLDRFGSRKTMGFSVVLAGLAYLFLSRVSALWMLYAGIFVAGGAVAGFTLIPAQTLMSQWFQRFRGRAIGLVMLGIGFGGLMFPPIVNRIIEVMGWSRGFQLGTLILWMAVLPLVLLFVRSKPADLDLLPDGASPNDALPDAEGKPAVGVPVGLAIVSLPFWLLASIVVLQTFGGSGMNLHFVPFAAHSGFTTQQAANFFGLAVGFSIIGRLAGGVLADRFNPRYLLVATGGLYASSVAVLAVMVVQMGITSTLPMYLFAPLYGLALGTGVVIMPVFIAQVFGLLHFSRILGLVNIGFGLGVILGPVLMGRLYVVTGGYHEALWMCFAAFALASVLPLLISPRRMRDKFAAAEDLATGGARPEPRH